MSPRFLGLLCASVSVLGLAYSGGAFGQPADQPAASVSSGLEEVVVTARRREEKIQTVPVAITAFSAKDIEERHIDEIHELIRSVPGLNASLPGSDANAPYSTHTVLRGLQGVAVYFADVAAKADYSTSTGVTHGVAPGSFFDLDHIEVDKGPQGTLFGRNSIGGLISIAPKRPSNDFEGYAKATLGDYSDREFEAAINVPIIADKLLVRVAGQSQTRDGYTIDARTGKDYDDRDYYSWRVGVTFRPSDDFENYLLYTGYWQHSNGGSTITKYVNPAFAPAVRLGFLTAFAQQQALGPRLENGRTTPGIGKDYFYGFVDQATWDINEDLSLKNIASANVTKTLATQDSDGTFVPLINIGDPINPHGWTVNEVQYTEEMRLQGKAVGGKLDWVVGGYLEYIHPLGDSLYETDTLGSLAFYHFNNSSRSQAVFAHGIYDLGDYVEGLRFTAGYRYTWDFASVNQRATNARDGINRNGAGAPTNCTALFADRNCENAVNGNFNSPGWNVSLDEQLTPDLLLYVRAGHAYRPGGFNLTVAPAFQKYQPEKVTDVEIGVKSEWDLMGVKGRTNADLFHTDYKSIQVSTPVSFLDATGVTRIANALTNGGAATVEGGELEATIIPFNGLELSGHYSYVFPQYDVYPGLSFKPPFIYYTKVEWGLSGTYHLPIDDSYGDVSLTATYSRNGQQYATIVPNDPLRVVPGYDVIDLRLDWTNIFGYPVDAAAFANNVTDNTYIAGTLPLYTLLGFSSVSFGPPRMYGFSLKYRFGGPSEAEETPAAYVPPPVVAPAPSVPKSYLVFFDFNKSDLTPQAVTIVDQAAHNAGPAGVTKLEVTGHTDTVGSDAYNMRLSRRRAESVAAQLEKDGVSSSEIEIIAKGKRDLLVPTADGVKEPQNRRVQIVYEGGPTS
ncbi:MAG: TonB-dependent receptor [Rhodospirillales bacterium]|nr:TonB-dependent receptor [Rhodospirillales bacterium]